MTHKTIMGQCEAHITINKGRSKIHKSNQIYLNNGQEFELEFFNPTTSTYLAKIKLNGVYTSSTGLIIRPGERVFLERYLDSPQKFLFSTYTVGANNSDVDNAIRNNGLIEIEFYEEVIPIPPPIPTYDWIRPSYTTYGNSYTRTTGGSGYYDTSRSIIGGSSGVFDDLSYFNSELSRETISDNSVGRFGKKKLRKSTKETGTVDKGSVSNQQFTTVNKIFSNYYTNVVTYKLLPLSEKTVQSNELVKYCTSCGQRAKRESRYCSACGNKL